MLLILKVELPWLESVIDWDALDPPTGTLENAKDAGLRTTTGVMDNPVPVSDMTWGDPAALSPMVMDPVRRPPALGVNVTEIVQFPLAGTMFPQVSVSEKSPTAEIDVMLSPALPKLRRVTCCAELEEPTCCEGYVKAPGVKDTEGAEAGPIFMTKPSPLPPGWGWKARGVMGKSVESVVPVK